MLMEFLKRLKYVVLVYLVGLHITVEQLVYGYLFGSTKSKRIFELRMTTQLSKGKPVAVVTGGSSGIGMAVVEKLNESGFKVISGAKNINSSLNREVQQVQLDLASPESVKNFVGTIRKTHGKIHVLVNCAGIMFAPYQSSAYGVEYHMAVNYVGHYFLTMELLPTLQHRDECHIINVTSSTYFISDLCDIDNWFRPSERAYIKEEAYARSKLAIILFTYKLQRFLKTISPKIHATVYDPGTVNTQLYQNSGIVTKYFVQCFGHLFLREPSDAADDILEILEGSSPPQTCYMGWKKKYEKTNKLTLHTKLQDDLWNKSNAETNNIFLS